MVGYKIVVLNAIAALRPIGLAELLYILLAINSAYNRAKVWVLLYYIALNKLVEKLINEIKKLNIGQIL